MEIDIRKAKEDGEIGSIRWGDNEVIMSMGKRACRVYGSIESSIAVKFEDVDNLILALKKYKELYGGS